MKDKLDWRYLKGLHKLYKEGSVRNKLMNNQFIKINLYQRLRLIGFRNGNMDIIESKPRFNAYFEKEFLEQYNYYSEFFQKSGLDNTALKKYDRYDLETLMFIFKNKDELGKKLSTARIFSSTIFKQKDSKYLESKPGLLKDVMRLLNIDKFPIESSKENQWRFVQDCPFPIAILLCENIDFIKAYWEFTKNNIELWYAGGNNTAKLKKISQRYFDLPIFYVCDWDYDGLKIYERISDIFKNKEKEIILITPDTPMLKPIESGNHKSKWKHRVFSGLNKELYTKEQFDLINTLINENKWIEEQTIEPITLIKSLTNK